MVKIGMLNGLRVREVMTEALLLLRAEMPVDEAWQILHDGGVSGAPVLDARGRLVGVISNYDLADPRRRVPNETTLVRDVMTRLVYAVRAGDSVLAAVRLMIDEKIHRVVAVNDDGSIAGVIVPMDILRVLARKEVGRLEYIDLRSLAGG
jgi:predicted transcriptional regulator